VWDGVREKERGGSYLVGEERANETEVWEEFWIDDVEEFPSVVDMALCV
jgi:hypothetical protein